MSTINDSANNGDVYVRVGDAGLIEYNLDPYTFDNAWFEASDVPTSKNLQAVVWSGFRFYAVGEDGMVLESDDAELWFEIEDATTLNSQDLFGAAASPDFVLACGADGTIIVSFDEGFSWEAIATATTQTLRDIDAGGGQFLAVGDNDTVVTGSFQTDDLEVVSTQGVALVEEMDHTGVYDQAVVDGIGVHSHGDREREFSEQYRSGQIEQSAFGDTITHEVSGDVETGVDESGVSVHESFLMVQNQSPLVAGDTGITKFGSINDFILNTQAVLTAGGKFGEDVAEDFTLLMRFPDLYEKIAEAFDVTGTWVGAYHKLLAEIVDVASTLSVRNILRVAADEIIAADDTLSTDGLLMVVAIDETGALAGQLSSSQLLSLMVEESPRFGVLLGKQGDVFDGWVANTEHQFFAVTQYTNYDFISMCFAKDGAFATDGEKLYKLDGDDDAGTDIDAEVQFAQTDFGTAFQKNVHRAYIGIRTSGDMVLKTITDQEVERYYQVKHKVDGLHNSYVKLGKGVKARYWAFELVNVDGTDFEIDSIEYVPVQLSKRSR